MTTTYNALFAGDLHVADKAPAGRVDDYKHTILQKLIAIRDLAIELGDCDVFFTGDIFHIKRPDRVSHRLVQELLDIFASFPNEVHVNPGNHDLGPSGIASLPDQPLGVLAKAGVVTINLHARRIILGGDEENVVAFWLIPRPYNAAAEGVYDGEVQPEHYTLMNSERLDIGKFPDPVIGLFHASIVGPGGSRPYPHFTADAIPQFEEYDLIVSGHLHENLGVVALDETTLFANPGSVARTSRNLPSYTRKVEVIVVSFTDGKMSIKAVPVPGVKPALEVFGSRLEDNPSIKNNEQIAQFVEALGQDIRAEKLSWEERLSSLGGDIPVPVLSEVQRLLEESDS